MADPAFGAWMVEREQHCNSLIPAHDQARAMEIARDLVTSNKDCCYEAMLIGG